MFFRKVAASDSNNIVAVVRDLIRTGEEDGEASMGGMSLVLPLLVLSFGDMDHLRRLLRVHLFMTHHNPTLYHAALRCGQLVSDLLHAWEISDAEERTQLQKNLVRCTLQELMKFSTSPRVHCETPR